MTLGPSIAFLVVAIVPVAGEPAMRGRVRSAGRASSAFVLGIAAPMVLRPGES